MSLKNKKVLITGATGGIGNNLVETFYNLGSNIVATGTNEEKLNDLKTKFPKINIEKFKLQENEFRQKEQDIINKKNILALLFFFNPNIIFVQY